MDDCTNLGCVEVRFESRENGPATGELTGKLVQTFGARITCHDWYADMRQCALRTIASQNQAGRPLSNPQKYVDDLDSNAREGGLRVGLAIPMEGGGYMIGTITQHRLVLTACCSLKESESVKSVVTFLRSLNIVAEVEVT